MDDALRTALTDIRGWAKKGAARDAGKRHGATLPEDSDFPEAVEEAGAEDVEAPLGDMPTEPVEGGEIAPEDLEQLLALLGTES